MTLAREETRVLKRRVAETKVAETSDLYTATLSNPGKGSFVLGYVEATSAEHAQEQVVAWLVQIGIEHHEAGRQVTDFSAVTVRGHTISLCPVKSLRSLRHVSDLLCR